VGVRALATDWPPTPTGHTLRGGVAVPLPGHLWPLATPHREREPPHRPTGEAGLWPKWEPHTTGCGSPSLAIGLWPPPPPTGHTLRVVASTLTGQLTARRGSHWGWAFAYWPPTATASPTGQRRGRPPLGEPHPSLASHWPPTGHKGTAIGGRPSHRPSLATYRLQWDGMGRLRLALPRLAT